MQEAARQVTLPECRLNPSWFSFLRKILGNSAESSKQDPRVGAEKGMRNA